MSYKKYKTIFFDWNKTLSNSLFWEQLYDPNHKRHDWSKNIGHFVFVKNRHMINEWMRGIIDSDEVAMMISDEYGYPKTQIIDDLVESCRNMQFVNDEILESIRKIREDGVKCVIATDNMDTFMKYTKPSLELEKYFDDFLVSFDVGKLKFDFEGENISFFDLYLSENYLDYQDVLLIDDHNDKTSTYARLGFDILQIYNPDDFTKKLHELAG